MPDDPIREPDEIRRAWSEKLRRVEVSPHFEAILGCRPVEDWTTPRLVETQITPDRHMLRRCESQAGFSTFLGASDDLIRNIKGVAPVAGLDGDELGFLLGKLAAIKRRA